MFHFTKHEGAFGRFALELWAADPKLIELKNIGVDMESAIYQGFKNFIPSANRLLCVRRLKQRDEKKLDKLLNRVKLIQLAINKLNSVLYKIYTDVEQVVFTSLATHMHSTKKILK